MGEKGREYVSRRVGVLVGVCGSLFLGVFIFLFKYLVRLLVKREDIEEVFWV